MSRKRGNIITQLVGALALLALAMMPLSATAQSAKSVVDKVIDTYSKSKGITANYAVSSAQGCNKGSIEMSGMKFRILSPEVKSWYDGKTMWTYSSLTEEVNVTTPTGADLQMSHPYIALMSIKDSSKMSLAVNGNDYVVTITPKAKGGIASVTLTIAKSTYLIEKAVIVTGDRQTFTTTISRYATGKNLPAYTFRFTKLLVPAGTQVVDLR